MTRSAIVSRIAHARCSESPSLLPEGRWWDLLSEDFADEPEGFALALGDKVQVNATAMFDLALRTAAATAVGTLALPLGYHPKELLACVDDLDFYFPMAQSGDPTRFFRPPPTGTRIRTRDARFIPRFTPDDEVVEILTFDSPFQPVNPRLHKPYLKHGRNRVAHARYIRHRDGGPRPTIVALHGFTADFYLINEWFFALPWFFQMGCDLLLPTLPFHGSRGDRLAPFSGHGFFAGGPSHLNEAVAQSVYDTRIFLDWLKHDRGAPAVGVTGVSLGGFTSALLATVEKDLAFAVPNVPVVSFADLVLEWEPIGTMIRTGLKLLRKSLVDARKMVAVSCPLTYAPKVPKERLMIVGGVGDRLAPPKHSRLLWDHWDRPRIHWFPGSHVLHLDRGIYLRQVARFLRGIDFLA